MNNNSRNIMEEIFGDVMDQLQNEHTEEVDEEDWEDDSDEPYVPDEQPRPQTFPINIPVNNTFNVPITFINNDPDDLEVFYMKKNARPKSSINESHRLTRKQKLIIALLKELGYPIDNHL